MLSQAFVSKFAVQAFDKCILCRLAWLNELQFSSCVFGPFEHGFRGEFGAIVHHNALGQGSSLTELRQEASNSLEGRLTIGFLA